MEATNKGYIALTEEQKKKRTNILLKGYNDWIKKGGRPPKTTKSNHQYWLEKYGKEIADQKLKDQKAKRSGKNNGMFKYSEERKKEVIDMFLTKKYTRSEISKKTGVSYSMVKNLLSGK